MKPDNSQSPATPPCLFFFYGTLMDPGVLRSIVGLDTDPVLQDAALTGFHMKLWNGRYPTLLSASVDATIPINGKIWQANNMEQYRRLQSYETSAYEPCNCVVKMRKDGSEVEAVTFKWKGDGESEELEDLEGGFDLEFWQENHKWQMF